MPRTARYLLMLGIVCFSAAVRAAPPAEAYGALPAMDFVRLSPSGKYYAYIESEGEKASLHVGTIDNKPMVIQSLGTANVRDVRWAGDDHILVSNNMIADIALNFRGPPKYELTTMVVFDILHRKMVPVFGRAHDQRVFNSVQGYYGTAQTGGHLYGYFSGVNDDRIDGHPHLDLYRVDLDSGALEITGHGIDYPDDWVLNDHGDVIARSFYNERLKDWRVEDMATGKTLAAGHADFSGVGGLYPGRNADTILVGLPIDHQGGGRDGYEYRELSLSGAPIKDVVDTGPMSQPIIDLDRHIWIGQSLKTDKRDSVFFNPVSQARVQGTAKAFPGYDTHLISWSADFGRMVVLTDGGDDSGTYWMVDIAAHSADQLGRQHPLIKAADVGLAQRVEWRASDGLALSGFLTLPAGKATQPYPLVVLPHGGPERRDYSGFDWWSQAYAGQGYADFQPNFRGSSGYGAEFRNAGFGQWGLKMQTDISDGVADLARRGVVDPKRVCIVGTDYGGYAALAGVTIQRGLYRCAVSVAGIADPSALLDRIRTDADGTRSDLRYWKASIGVGDTWASGDISAISPLAQAAHADAPVLLIHGKDDAFVLIDQSEAMARALSRAGKPVELVTINNEDHRLRHADTRIQILKHSIDFVEKYNPPN